MSFDKSDGVLMCQHKHEAQFDRADGVTVCLAGVLYFSGAQFDQVSHYMPGQVLSFHETGPRLDLDRYVDRVVSELESYQGLPVRFVGASIGGMQLPFVIRAYRERYPDADPNLLQAVIIDAPSGLESLCDPNAKLLKSKITAGVLSYLPQSIKFPIRGDMLPRWDDISVPTHVESEKIREFKEVIRESARVNMKGFPASLFASQGHWMITAVENGSLEKTCATLDDIKTIYVICKLNNGTVRPLAAERWKQWVPHLQIMSVDATHVGFVQNLPEFAELFTELFPN
jgi:hypothetical protein